MRSNGNDDELLRSYLLGELTGEEAERLEGRLLAEDDLFELSEAVEADLLEEYAQGSLAPAERERVQRRLASSPRGRERLAMTRALRLLAAGGSGRGAILPFVPHAREPARPRLRWIVALAAGLLVAAGLAWLALVRPPVAQRVAERPAPPLAPVPRAHEVPKAPAPPAPTVAPEPVKAVFQLSLLSLRGAESREKLRVPADAGTVELQISVEGMEDFQTFHLTVRDRNGKIAKEERGLKPRTLKGARAIVLDLPADLLPAGKYEIQPQGLALGQEPEDLSPLGIEVVRQGNL
jgi:hypothetical protein